MKRKSFTAALLTALIIVTLSGAAFGIASHLGVLDFISPDGGLSLPSEVVQTEFTQDGGKLGAISVRVRDAVCDGRTLFIAVEATVENEEDALLMTVDAFDLGDPAAMESWLSAHPDEAVHPDFDALKSAAATHYMMPILHVQVASSEDPGSIIPYVGTDWRYEGMGTIVTHIMINMQEVENPEDILVAEIHAGTSRLATEAEYRAEYGEEFTASMFTPLPFIFLDSTVLTTEIKAGSMDIRTAKAEVPFTHDGFRYTRFEVATSPLATYVVINRARVEGNDQSGLAYPTILDERGNAFERLGWVQRPLFLPNEEGTYDGVPLHYIFKRSGDLPQSVTLQANPAANAPGETQPLPEDLTLLLMEII